MTVIISRYYPQTTDEEKENLFEEMIQMNEKNNDITITLSRKELPTLLYMLGVMYGFSNDEQIASIIDKIRQVALKELE